MKAVHITDADIGEKLQGKPAIVTGRSSGLGQGTASHLTKAGARVLNGDIQAPTDPIDSPMYSKCAAGSWDSQLALLKLEIQHFGRSDIVVPNAGFCDRGDYFYHVDEQGDTVKSEFACLKVMLIWQTYGQAGDALHAQAAAVGRRHRVDRQPQAPATARRSPYMQRENMA